MDVGLCTGGVCGYFVAFSQLSSNFISDIERNMA